MPDHTVILEPGQRIRRVQTERGSFRVGPAGQKAFTDLDLRDGMERRVFLGQAGMVGSALLAGCTAVSGIRERLTGRVAEPRAVSIRNEDRVERSVTVTVTDTTGQTLLQDSFRVLPDASRETVWETRRVGRYTITAETDTGVTVSTEINVCVGYHDAWVVLYPESVEITGNKMYGDPAARYCTVD